MTWEDGTCGISGDLILIPEKKEVPFLLRNLSHKGLHLVLNDIADEKEADALIKLAEKEAH